MAFSLFLFFIQITLRVSGAPRGAARAASQHGT
jgi:hypothetical protein